MTSARAERVPATASNGEMDIVLLGGLWLPVEEWDEVVTLPGWIRQQNNPDLRSEISGIYTLAVFRVLVPFDTDVRPGDHVVVEGATYLVQNTNVEDTNRVSLVVIVQKLENA